MTVQVSRPFQPNMAMGEPLNELPLAQKHFLFRGKTQMSIFTEQELKLLAQSAHHSPRLAEWLERVLVEGPGDYDWMLTAEGFYTNDQIPLFENILAEIEDQGTIYPATLVAVPVLCQLPECFPQQDHSVLLETLDRLEEARRVQNYDGAAVPENILDKYVKALADLKASASAQAG